MTKPKTPLTDGALQWLKQRCSLAEWDFVQFNRQDRDAILAFVRPKVDPDSFSDLEGLALTRAEKDAIEADKRTIHLDGRGVPGFDSPEVQAGIITGKGLWKPLPNPELEKAAEEELRKREMEFYEIVPAPDPEF